MAFRHALLRRSRVVIEALAHCIGIAADRAPLQSNPPAGTLRPGSATGIQDGYLFSIY